MNSIKISSEESISEQDELSAVESSKAPTHESVEPGELVKIELDDSVNFFSSSEEVEIGLPPEPTNSNAESLGKRQDSSIPWYLRQDVTSNLLEYEVTEIPNIPANSPPHLSGILDVLAKHLGIKELKIFDINALDETHQFKSNHPDLDFVVIGTGASERHIYKAANELRYHIKHTYGVIPVVQGKVSSAKSSTARRRLVKRARKGPTATDNDYGFTANSWVLCKHDGVEVHMLTNQRRAELNLELIWCLAEDLHLYEPKEAPALDSDDILVGLGGRRATRSYHTNTRHSTTVSKSLESNTEILNKILVELQNLPVDVGDHVIESLKRKFEERFKGTSPKHYDMKNTFLTTVHLARLGIVSFADVEESLLLKYASSIAYSTDLSLEKAKDVTQYARLLIDSPELIKDSKAALDLALDKLSRFISALFEYSNDKFLMSADPMFLPLLWRLTYTESGRPITSRLVSDVIQGRKQLVPGNGEPSSMSASNNARDVLCLVLFHDQKNKSDMMLDQNELIFFTYGNSGKWDYFWNEWSNFNFLSSPSTSEMIDRWVRLVVYLALTGNKAQAFKFLSELWTNSSCVTGSFLDAYEKNGNKFNYDTQREAFVSAVEIMASLLEDLAFDKVRATLAQMVKKLSKAE